MAHFITKNQGIAALKVLRKLHRDLVYNLKYTEEVAAGMHQYPNKGDQKKLKAYYSKAQREAKSSIKPLVEEINALREFCIMIDDRIDGSPIDEIFKDEFYPDMEQFKRK
jgi:hypothetical protein